MLQFKKSSGKIQIYFPAVDSSRFTTSWAAHQQAIMWCQHEKIPTHYGRNDETSWILPFQIDGSAMMGPLLDFPDLLICLILFFFLREIAKQGVHPVPLVFLPKVMSQLLIFVE
ncbi:hypothetical protein TNCT_500431 [Trichonephila clavata]|uniref:Uncharacterized protein n=1 Tax=Trichonephila clavata TaxID=2740835 RepID=A0A8X6HAA5_TRICU|nr:hypothetical protein TNCT_500431 [Trichonephila clavata]